MLKVLRRIVQEINSAHDFGEALSLLVHRVRETVATEACTVFLVDHDAKQYVMAATDGLNQKVIGKIRFGIHEGLVGLIGLREEPINLEDAPSHPQFVYHPDIGEERFKALLGVPIIHHRRLYGVLVVQQEECRKFDEAEEAFLITMSAQLAGIIAHAEATGEVAKLLNCRGPHRPNVRFSFEGIASSPGVGIGQAVVVYPKADIDAIPDRGVEEIDKEIESFISALKAARSEIKALGERLSPNLPSAEQELFSVYLRILDSSAIVDEVCDEIRAGNWAQGALRRVIKNHVRNFEAMEDTYLQERAADIRDLGLRVLAYLQESQQEARLYPEKTILVGEEVTASALAEVPTGRLLGVVSVRGSNNSHVAILARALGVPAVMGVEGLAVADHPIEGTCVIVDGYYGQIYIEPSSDLVQEYQALCEEQRELDINLKELQDVPAVTPDGYSVNLFVNIGLVADAGLSLVVGAEGVGLYRSEIPFMTRDRFPAEEEQRVIYRQLLHAFTPRSVVMRTLDVGGDKVLPYFSIKEDNPFLGWRGIRVTLDHPEVFLMQIRAMLKASKGFDNLSIMLPMVTWVGELEDAIELIEQAYEEVLEEGIEIKKPPIGVMIEVPSAVYQAYHFAKRADFISVGSNDLTQYILAVDRNNSRVASLYNALHPAVLRALIEVVEAGHRCGKQVSICGEMAGDAAAVILLMAMGFDTLSMNAVSLPRIKWVIRSITLEQAKKLLIDVMQMEHPMLIRFHLEKALEQAGLSSLIHAAKS